MTHEEWKKARVEAALSAYRDSYGEYSDEGVVVRLLRAIDAVPHPSQSSRDCATHDEMVEVAYDAYEKAVYRCGDEKLAMYAAIAALNKLGALRDCTSNRG